MSFLEPWLLLRVATACVVTWLFVRAAITGVRVIRRFDARKRTEGQLLLERHLELSATYVRVGALLQAASVFVAVLGADRLSRGVRGAMCAYGVFTANEYGLWSLGTSALLAVVAGIIAQVHIFDGRMRTLELARPLAWIAVAMAPLAVADLALVLRFVDALDLSVVASCCSVELGGSVTRGSGLVTAPRVPMTLAALVSMSAAAVLAFRARRASSRFALIGAGVASVVALPFAAAAVALEVAPHVFEVPDHVCPFCLLRTDALMIGYPLFLAMGLAVTWLGGAALSAWLAPPDAREEPLGAFVRPRLSRGAVAWLATFVIGAIPIVVFAVQSGGASLFP